MLEDTVLTSLNVDPGEALAERQLLDYLHSPGGFKPSELVALLAWLDTGHWIVMPAPRLGEMLNDARQDGRVEARSGVRHAA